MNSLKSKFDYYIKERQKIHPNNDFEIYEKWKELTEILSTDIDETLLLLNQATQEEILYVSEVFEELAFIVKSPKYITCLENLAQKFPEAKLHGIVEIAKSYHLA